MSRKPFMQLLKYLIAIVLMMIVLYSIDWDSFLSSLTQIDPLYLVLAIIAHFAGTLFAALRWRNVLDSMGTPLKLSMLFKAQLVGAYYNTFMPSAIGGDVFKFLKLQHEVSKKDLAYSILLDRVYGLAAGMGLSILVYLALGASYTQDPLLMSAMFLMAGLTAAFLFSVLFKSPALRIFARLYDIWSYKYWQKFWNFAVYALSGLNKPLMPLVYSILFNLAIFLEVFLLFTAFKVEIPFYVVAILSPVISLITMLPISINAIGLKEGAYAYFYPLFGIAAPHALLVSVVSRVVFTLVSLVGIIFV